MDRKIHFIYTLPQTVFTTREIAWLWRERKSARVHALLRYYTKKRVFVRLTRGIFAKTVRHSGMARYSALELAVKIYTPSYVSFETALVRAGMRFEEEKGAEVCCVASRYSRVRWVDGKKFVYRRLKNRILFNSSGIVVKDGQRIAGRERAFLDTLYVHENYYFDSLTDLNWEKCFQMVKLYKNKALERRLWRYYRIYKAPEKVFARVLRKAYPSLETPF